MMNNRGKKWFVASTAIFGLMLSACGSESPDGGESSSGLGGTGGATGTADAPSDPVTISVAHWVFAEPGRGEAVQAIIDEFNASQNGVIVETVEVPFPSYAETITTQVGGGGGPDVMALDEDTFYLAVTADWLLDITDISYEGELGPTAAVAFDGDRRVAIPWEGINYALIVNKTILDAAGVPVPTNFQEFLAAARAATGGGTYGFATRHTMNQEAGWWYDITNWVYGYSGEWTDGDGTPTVNRPENVKAVEAYVQFINEGLIPIGAGAAEYRQMFWEGQVAMVIDNASLPGVFIAQNPDIADDLVYVDMPFENPTNIAISIFMGVNANTKHPEAAVKFIEYVLKPGVQAKIQEGLGGSNVARNISPSDELVNQRPHLPVFARAGAYGRPMPPQGQETKNAEIRFAILSELDRVVAGSLTPQEALDRAQAAVKEIVSR